MNKKKIFLGILAVTIILSGLSGCKDNKENDVENKIDISQNVEQEKTKENYNNGGSFVSYKGKTYYREYNNASIEKVALWGDFYYDTENKVSKYINAISENGRIENVFKDDGYGDFYIADDRFFFRGYQNKLYSVDMKGENYRDICKGYYVHLDEENHELYYVNIQNNNSLYKINTQSLGITKIMDEVSGTPYFYNEKMYSFETDESNNTKLLELDLNQKTTKEIVTIEHEKNDSELYDNYYYVASSVIYNNKMFISMGYDAGTANEYNGGKIYCIDLDAKEVKELDDENVPRNLIQKDNMLYYQKNDMEGTSDEIKQLNMDTLEVKKVSNNGDYIVTTDAIALKNEDYIYVDGVNYSDKVVLSKFEIEAFKEKYVTNNSMETCLVQVREIEKVNDKVYFLVELIKRNEAGDIGWREAYERIASEKYSYDLNTGKKTLIYLYKVTDKEVIESGESLSGDVLEPLGENEMYLEIRLKDKGLKDTFEIRVEEVGGLIMGKRIEYEGVHSRVEEILTIKVTREVGAMLSVYIDNKLDSQMLIEAE